MAQVGRISGPLLEANLLRQGIANGTQANLSFKNTNSDTTLLKVDVANGRIGVDLEAPANELQISQTIQTVDAIAQTADIGNFNLSNTDINVNSGDLYLKANEAIVLSNLETEQFYASDNFISTKDTNASIELKPSGTGTVESNSINVRGNLHSTNNITLDGNIIFGDTGDDSTQLSDTVSINADINSNIIPTISDAYSVGSNLRSWDEIHTHFVNGQLVNSGLVTVNNIAIDGRVGNIFYVAANGSNNNVGDHPQGPLATIEEALSRADASTDGPVMIKVFAGEYEENLPLVVPNRVSIIGNDFRNVVIKPAVGSESKDVFHLDDSTLISNLTIKDFYYDSGNNTGYAFRFSPGAVITNRSPYVQDVTVITKGSVTSASDPRGFDQGDAGKGAWIDGAELDSASVEASMLFHAATFITPGVDAITMTNGVRVEWLNSFTYFANRGLYAVNGVTGRTSYDGSTVKYGAEVRAIGSANIYGNYGAVADGADTLMYLIQHNMAYIGTGKFVDNDTSRAIYDNEITELNNGVVHYSTTDHLGGFRIGDNFWVDFETGNTTINIDTLSVDQFTGLRVNTNNTTTVIDGAFIDTGNLTISNNLIEATSGDLNVASATGQINLLDNTNVIGNVNVTGNLGFGGTLNIAGNEATDSLSFNTELDQSFNPHQHQTYTLGSFEKKWLQAHLDRIETPDFSFFDNVIQLNSSNADIELRASGTGKVNLPSGANISNNFTVVGDSVFNGTVDVTVPNFPLTGDLTTFGNLSTTGNFDVDGNLTVGANAQFEEILFDSNFITTTTSNADLELRASGTGTINLQENVNVTNNLSADNIDATNITATLNVTADNANIGDVEINDNYIQSTAPNTDIELTVSGAFRSIVAYSDVNFAQDLTVNGSTDLQDTVELSSAPTLIHTLNNPQPAANAQFGNYLRASTSGNYAIIGADTAVSGGKSFGGRAYIYNLITGNVVFTIENPDAYVGSTSLGDRFGISTSIDGNRAIVGAFEEDDASGQNNGKAYIFETASGDWTDTTLLHTLDNPNAYNATNGDLFGLECAISGNYAVVGAYNEDQVGIINSGKAYIFDVTTGALLHTLDNPNPSQGDFFGARVEMDGERAILGVYNEDGGSGKAYIYDVPTGTLLTTLDNPNAFNTGSNDRFGISADISGDRAVVGAYREDALFQNNEGKAYIFDVTTGTLIHTLDNPNPGAGDEFGNPVQISGNIALVTSREEAFGAGRVYVYDVRTGNLLYTLIDPNPIAGSGDDHFSGTAISDDYIIAGAPQEEDFYINSGKAYVYKLNKTEPAIDVNITGNVVQSGNTTQTGNLTLLGEFTNGNILIEDNFITATNSNSDLELRANSTGEILIPNNDVQINNNLTVSTDTDLQGTTITGTLTHVGDTTHTGNITQGGELTVDNVYIEDNFITTNISNADLELRAPAPTADLDALQASLTTRSSNGTDDLTSFWNEIVDGYQRGDINNSGNINIDDVMAFLSFNRGLTSPTSAQYIWIQNNIINPIESDPVLYANYIASISINVPQNNVEIDQNLTVNGTTSLQGTTITGTVTHTGNRTQTGNLDVAGEISNGNILIEDNFITTTDSNSDLEFRAAGTGSIKIVGNATITDNVTVNASSDLQSTTINGTLTHTGDRNQTGQEEFSLTPKTYFEVRKVSNTLTGQATWRFQAWYNGTLIEEITLTDAIAVNHTDDYLSLSGYTRGAEDPGFILDNSVTDTTRYNIIPPSTYTLNGELAVDDVYIEDNFITTTASNANLELRAPADTATISIVNDLQVENNFTANLATLQSTSITGTLTHVGDTTHTGTLNVAGELTVDNVYIEDNFITTTVGNLTLEASGTGNILISDNLNVTGNLSALNSTVNGVTVNGDITHTGNTTQNGNLDVAGELTIDNIQFEDNFITTTDVNVEQGNLKLFASGTGNVVFDAADPVTINNNLTVKGTMFYNGSLTINGNVQIQGNLQDGSLTVSDDFSITGGLDVSSQAQFEEILLEDNFITTTTSNANLELRASGTGEILVPDDNVMHVNNNLFTASITTGDINVNQDLQLNEIIIPPSVIEIDDNFISTRISNANLELRANGSGVVQFNDNTTISANLISSQTSNLNNVTINGLKNHIGNLDQTGTYTLIGDMSVGVLLTDEEFQFGDVSMSGNLIQTTLSNSNLELRAAGTGEVKLDDNVNITNNINVGSLNVNQITSNGDLSLDTFELSSDIRFFDNVITTTNSNSNLELRAAGTANIHLENFRVNDNRLFTEGTSNLILTTPNNIKIDATGSLKLPAGSVLQRITALDTFLDGGSATLVGATLDGGNASTVFTPTDTIYNSGFAVLVASGNTGDIRFNTDENVFEGTSADTVTFGGVFSSNRLTSVTADPYSNNIRMMVNGAIDPIDSSNLVGEVTGDSFRIHGLRADEILLDNNTITTFNSNSDLELRTDGTGELSLEDISLKGNLIKNNSNNTIIRNTGFGKTKFPDTYGIVIPYGNNTTDRPVADPEVGDVRWNQSDVILEAWNGTQYQSAAGVAAAISEQEFNDLLLEFTLIFG